MRDSLLPSLLAALLLTIGAVASAHGPTVQLSYGRVSPERLVIRAGETVHFHNRSTTARTYTVRGEDDAFTSPPLARGEGWHHEFPEPGSFAFVISEFPDMKGRVVVAPAEE